MRRKTRKVYVVTGVDRNGKRFKLVTTNRIHAFGVNLYRGNVWIQDHTGKRKLLASTYN